MRRETHATDYDKHYGSMYCAVAQYMHRIVQYLITHGNSVKRNYLIDKNVNQINTPSVENACYYVCENKLFYLPLRRRLHYDDWPKIWENEFGFKSSVFTVYTAPFLVAEIRFASGS